MEFVKILSLVCIFEITCWHLTQAVSLEPEFTKYQFIEQVIERMVRMSDKMDDFVKKMDNFQNTMDQWKDKMEAINGTVTQTLYDMEANNREFKSNLTAVNKQFLEEMTAWRENNQLVLNSSFVDFNERTSIALTNIIMNNTELRSNLTTVINDAHQRITEWREDATKELNDAVIGIKEKTNTRLVGIEADNREFKSNLTTVNKAFQTEIEAWRDKTTLTQEDIKLSLTNLETNFDSHAETKSVAFNVYSTTSQSLDSSEAVVFDMVRLNTCGDCYSTTTGIFTAPVGGIYQFNAQLCADKGGDLEYGIVSDRVNVFQSEFRAASDSDDMKCTAFSVVAQVGKEQTVYVNGYNHPLKAQGGDELSFSGVLVKPL